MRWTSRTFTYTHAKYLSVDNSRVWIGTPNWTTSAFKNNREFAIIDSDPALARETEAVIAAGWSVSRR